MASSSLNLLLMYVKSQAFLEISNLAARTKISILKVLLFDLLLNYEWAKIAIQYTDRSEAQFLDLFAMWKKKLMLQGILVSLLHFMLNPNYISILTWNKRTESKNNVNSPWTMQLMHT